MRPPPLAASAPPPVGPHEVEVRGERVERGVHRVQEIGWEGRRGGGFPREGGEIGHGRERGQQTDVCATLRVLLKYGYKKISIMYRIESERQSETDISRRVLS